MATFEPDPEYDLVLPAAPTKRGQQCGKCGMKFDYNVGYGFYCQNAPCPMGYGSNCFTTTSK